MALDVSDKTSNNNDLTNNGGVTEVTTSLPFAQSTSCADLEASSTQSLSIADASQTGLDLTGDFTFEFWVKFESLPSSGAFMWLIGKDDSGQRQYDFRLHNDGGTLKLEVFIFQDGTTYDNVTANWTPSTGTWYHVALTCDISNTIATEFEFFVDGSSIGNGSVVTDGSVATIQNATAVFYLGYFGTGGGSYLDGQLDDVRIWSDIRTSTEITDNKDIELTGTETNLVAYWPFEVTLGVGGANFFALL